jgi:hypothetical protein
MLILISSNFKPILNILTNIDNEHYVLNEFKRKLQNLLPTM